MTERTLFVSPAIYTESGAVDGYLLIEDGRIACVEAGAVPAHLARVPRIEAPACRILPGFIDLHVHGFGGWTVEAGTGEDLRGLAQHLAYNGVTAFWPTCAAVPLQEMEAAIVAVREHTRGWSGGARILGVHLEGPYLNPAQKGAMRPELLRNPNVDEMRRFLEIGGGATRRVTVAPELPGALDLIRFLVDHGIMVAGGHTNATYAETETGIKAGVRVANHTYNAMRGLHHREPGALGAYMTAPEVVCEAICDLRHVHPAALAVLLRVAGYDRVAVISDTVAAAGLPPGRYQLYGMEVRIDDLGYSRLPDGTIAGSTLPVLSGLQHLVEVLGVSLERAWPMLSLVPARIAGVADCKGSLRPGKDADLVVLDEEWRVHWVVVEGRIVRRPDDPQPPINPIFLENRLH